MAKKTKLEVSEESFSQFTSIAPDLKRSSDRVLPDELNKKSWQTKVIDNFEQSIGIPSGGRTPGSPPKMNYKNRLFEPTYDKDQNLLNELMNSPKYRIVYLKDNWTPDGSYKIFVIYGEIEEPATTIK